MRMILLNIAIGVKKKLDVLMLANWISTEEGG